jgi:hypothetical protein
MEQNFQISEWHKAKRDGEDDEDFSKLLRPWKAGFENNRVKFNKPYVWIPNTIS